MKRIDPGVQSPPRTMLVLTRELKKYVDNYAKRHEISKSEAVRQIIAGYKRYEEDYMDLLIELAE